YLRPRPARASSGAGWSEYEHEEAPPAGAGGASCDRSSVAVVVRLVGALHRDAEVFGLLLGQLGELDAEGVEVQPGDLLVEVLGQRVDADRVLLGLGEQLDLRDRL